MMLCLVQCLNPFNRLTLPSNTPGLIQSKRSRNSEKIYYFTDYFEKLFSFPQLQSGTRESVFQFESEDIQLLPLRDVAVFGNGEVTQEFGFTIGPACFS